MTLNHLFSTKTECSNTECILTDEPHHSKQLRKKSPPKLLPPQSWLCSFTLTSRATRPKHLPIAPPPVTKQGSDVTRTGTKSSLGQAHHHSTRSRQRISLVDARQFLPLALLWVSSSFQHTQCTPTVHPFNEPHLLGGFRKVEPIPDCID